MARGRSSHAAAAIVAVMLWSCGGVRQEDRPAVTWQPIEAVLAAHNDSLMAVPGVVGTAIGRCDGEPCIRVFLAAESAAARRHIPAELAGYPVRIEVTGPIRAR